MKSCFEPIERLKAVLQDCDAVVIGAGSGLSTAAGFTYTGERFEKYFSDFAAKYGHLGLHWMQVGAQNADGLCYYDIVRGGMDKGVGLADLCEKMGLTLADAVAAGDSANDVAMLKAAGLGCCMANGTPDAKAAADRIIGDVREDGLADLIDELWFDGPRAEPSGRDLGSPWDKIESAGGQ